MIRNLYIRSTENSGEATYGMDSQPVFFNGAGFSPLIGILKSNYRAAKEVTATLQRYADAFAKVRDENQRTGNLTDDEMEGLELDDNELMEVMALAGIEAQKRLKDCLKYEDGEIRVDYRLLYMVSYDQYQRQYLYHADRLKEVVLCQEKVQVKRGLFCRINGIRFRCFPQSCLPDHPIRLTLPHGTPESVP